ncbi:MAG: UbiA family prenyltransferase [Candidatus Methanoperedens sp.]|nr:UbiA family prenyltransferase [Candidatus Methanoperedens sp.]
MFAISYRSSEMILSLLYIFVIGIGASLLSSFASNLWNHTNDLKEDIAQGKKTVLTLNLVSQRTAVVLSMILYGISTIIIYYMSIRLERPVILFFLVWLVITWWYSDNIFLRKIFGFRLKTHYIGEIITYGIAYPFYTLSIWLIYSDLNTSGVALALSFSFLGISGVLLKDLKDISGDRKAGLRTLGVIFTPSKLLNISCIFLILYYLVILDSIALKVYNIGMLLVIIPFIWFLKNTFYYFHKKGWKLEACDFKSIKTMMISTYLSLIALGIGALI